MICSASHEVADADAVDFRDDVTGPQAAVRCRAPGIDARNEQAGSAAGLVVDDLRAFEHRVELRASSSSSGSSAAAMTAETSPSVGRNLLLAAIANQPDLHRLAGAQQTDGRFQRARVANAMLVDADDHVADLDAGPLRARVRRHCGDERARVVVERVGLRELGRDVRRC